MIMKQRRNNKNPKDKNMGKIKKELPDDAML